MSTIMKVSRSLLVAVFAVMTVLPAFPVSAEGPAAEPFEAIAKIRTFTLDENSNLTESGFGSGIIINSSGLMLTNSHVVEMKSDFDNSDLPLAYQVCLPTDMTSEPDCSFTAKLIAKDEDLDVALLQVSIIPTLSLKNSFPYLELAQTDTVNVNDPLTAIGYPDIGGSTVTTTQGTVAGKTDKYGKKWFKTDAVISFGSSGGAALDENGKVIGITSAGHADLLGSLGYVIDVASISGWISENRVKTPIDSPLASRLILFAVKEKSLNQSNAYENPAPRFTITKPADWEFMRFAENQLYITNPGDDDGGDVHIMVIKQPYMVDSNSIIPFLRRDSLAHSSYSIFKVNEEANVKVGNVNGKRIRYNDQGSQNTAYALPIRDYIMLINYSYGTEDKDKALVEGIVKSLNVPADSSPFFELKKYTHADPYFSLAVDRDWVMQQNNSQDSPLIIVNKKYRDLYITVDVRPVDDNTRNLNNDALMAYYREQMDSINMIGTLIDLKLEMSETNAHYKVSNDFSEALKALTTFKARESNKVIAYEFGYTKKVSPKFILNFSMYTTNTDRKALATYQSEFNRLMKNVRLKAVAPKTDTDKDGLNDEDEKKFGTNPNNRDTDGDGYSDWTELNNGYNPLGPGKLKRK